MAVRMDSAQPAEQLALDIGCKLSRQLRRPRRPAEHDSPLGTAEIVEEPGTTRHRRLRRTLHLEQPQQLFATVLVGHLMAREKLLLDGRMLVDKEPYRLL